MTFTHDELLQALESARQSPQDDPRTITSSELASAWGVSPNVAREAIRNLLREGTLSAESVWRTNMTGERQRIKGYRLVQVGDA